MVQVQEATYVIDPAGGGQLRAEMLVGEQKLSTTLPVNEEDAFLKSILDDLTVRLETVSYLAIEGRREVHVTLTLGERQFIAHIPLEEGERTLGPSIDLLLQTVGSRFMKLLESSLANPPAGEVGAASGVPAQESI